MKIPLHFINYYFLRFLFMRLAVCMVYGQSSHWLLFIGLWPWKGYNGSSMNPRFNIRFPKWTEELFNKSVKFES